ncbi:MAG: histidinol dehydrogenase [Deltaproteobacteria bacterium]|nr:histidinol dehydrogenase [Deltaproteobacteria bacterium]
MRVLNSNEFSSKKYFIFSESDIKIVKKIIADVERNGDKGVIKFTQRFDGVRLNRRLLRVPESYIKSSVRKIDGDLEKTFRLAIANIERFSKAQMSYLKNFTEVISNGVFCSQKIIPIDRVGIYVPSGNFPLISTLFMCAVPAYVAGVKELAVFSPPRFDGDIHPLILQAAGLLGIREVYRIGGVQAIAAMSFGTESVKPVSKIVGPGNKYVALAKKEVFGRVGIDMVAGPSEVLIIADESANPDYLAADMIAQSEHDLDASAILLTTSKKLAFRVMSALKKQIENNPNRKLISKSLEKNGCIVLCKDMSECVRISNSYAPEHLELVVKDGKGIINRLYNYGSLFVGRYSTEVFGDYTAGINHTLPTNGAARYRGGLSVFDFVKITTQLRVDKVGFDSLKDATIRLAKIEGLIGHYRAIEVRDFS